MFYKLSLSYWTSFAARFTICYLNILKKLKTKRKRRNFTKNQPFYRLISTLLKPEKDFPSKQTHIKFTDQNLAEES